MWCWWRGCLSLSDGTGGVCGRISWRGAAISKFGEVTTTRYQTGKQKDSHPSLCREHDVSIRILIFFSFLTLKHHPHESSVLSLPPTPLKAFSRSKHRVTSFCGKKNYAASAMCLVGCIEKQWSQLFAGKKPDLLYHLLGVLLRTSKKKETQPLIPSSLTSLYSALPPPTRHLILSLSHLPPLSVFSSPSLSVLMPGTLLSVVFNIWFVLGLELTQNTNRIN